MRHKSSADTELDAMFGYVEEQPTAADLENLINQRFDTLENQIEKVSNNILGVGMAIFLLCLALYFKWL